MVNARVRGLRDQYAPELIKRDDVISVGIGLDDQGEEVIKVRVKNAVSKQNLLPAGLPSDIVEVEVDEPITAHSVGLIPPEPETDAQGRKDKTRPVPPGVSAGHPQITAGTVGFQLSDGAQTFTSSNNHVYADVNAGNPGDDIYQPGPTDGGTSNDVSATLEDYVPLEDGTKLDFAWASQDVEHTNQPEGIPTPKGAPKRVEVGDTLTKSGRTTGVTEGTVEEVDVTVTVGYGGGNSIELTDQIFTSDMSDGGDSGSLALHTDDDSPGGIIFAGNSTTSVLNQAVNVKAVTGLDIVSGEGREPSGDVIPRGISAPDNAGTGEEFNCTVDIYSDKLDETDSEVFLSLNGQQINSDLVRISPGQRRSTTFKVTIQEEGEATLSATTDTSTETVSTQVQVGDSGGGGGGGTAWGDTFDPIPGGVSEGTQDMDTSATSSFLVTDGSNQYMLSSYFAFKGFGPNEGNTDTIVQPGPAQATSRPASNVAGSVPAGDDPSGASTSVVVAWASPDEVDHAPELFGTSGPNNPPQDPSSGETVEILGPNGSISASVQTASTNINLNNDYGSAIGLQDQFIATYSGTLPSGWSGAPVMSGDTPLGIVIGANTDQGLVACTKATNIEAQAGVAIVTGDGRQPPDDPPDDPPSKGRKSRFSDVPLGVSVGHIDITAGTAGFLLTDGTNVYPASNNHVYAAVNAGSPGDTILQPGSADGGAAPDDKSGELNDYVPIETGTKVDMAWINPTDRNFIENIFERNLKPKGAPRRVQVGDTLVKSGRTTGVTTGSVQQVNASVDVGGLDGTVTFEDQILTGDMSDGGDSGSAALFQSDDAPAGALFAGSNTTTVFNQAVNWESESGLQIVSEGRTSPPNAEPTVNSLNLSTSSAQPGDSVTANVSVENTGDGTSDEPLEIQVNGSTEATIDLSLDAGESRSVSETVTAPDANEMTVTAVFASTGSSKSQTIPIDDPPSDGRAVVSALSASQSSARPGDNVDFTATLTNPGGQEVTDTLEFELNGTVVSSGDESISAGGEVEVTQTITAPDTANEMQATASFTSSGSSKQISIPVNEPPSPANPVVQSVNAGSSSARPGDSVNFTTTVENTGDERANTQLELSVNGSVQRTVSMSIGPGQTFTDTSSLVAPDATSMTVTARAVSTGSTGTTTIPVRKSADTEVEITAVDAPSEVAIGDDFTAVITVENTGDTTETVRTSFISRVGDEQGQSRNVTLDPGETRDFRVSATMPAQAGQGTAVALQNNSGRIGAQPQQLTPALQKKEQVKGSLLSQPDVVSVGIGSGDQIVVGTRVDRDFEDVVPQGVLTQQEARVETVGDIRAQAMSNPTADFIDPSRTNRDSSTDAQANDIVWDAVLERQTDNGFVESDSQSTTISAVQAQLEFTNADIPAYRQPSSSEFTASIDVFNNGDVPGTAVVTGAGMEQASATIPAGERRTFEFDIVYDTTEGEVSLILEYEEADKQVDTYSQSISPKQAIIIETGNAGIDIVGGFAENVRYTGVARGSSIEFTGMDSGDRGSTGPGGRVARFNGQASTAVSDLDEIDYTTLSFLSIRTEVPFAFVLDGELQGRTTSFRYGNIVGRVASSLTDELEGDAEISVAGGPLERRGELRNRLGFQNLVQKDSLMRLLTSSDEQNVTEFDAE